VDFESQRRTPKASAHFYSQVIATHGSSLNEDSDALPRARPARRLKGLRGGS
jgi:hypothetical protein